MNYSTQLFIDALEQQHISWKSLHKDGNVVAFTINGRPLHFIFNNPPLNSHSVFTICKDKEFTHSLLHKHINMPKTLGFTDPNIDEKYAEYIRYHSVDEILNAAEKECNYPVIVKPNRGAEGRLVTICHNREEAEAALKAVYANSKQYDYVALVQELIEITNEYRVVVLSQNIQFVYTKYTPGVSKDAAENISPLHQEGSKAIKVTDEGLIRQLQLFVQPIFKHVDLQYGGIDIAEDRDGKLWLIELNDRPGFNYFIRDNGEDEVRELFGRVVRLLQKR